ncbi:MAG: signal peptide peptidase SppA [Aquificae bacterium]|nr:signal peptide peptidase SppA [Aquificota bacterium]
MKKLLLFLSILIIVLTMIQYIQTRLPIGHRIAVLKLTGVITNPYPLVNKIESLKKSKNVVALVLRVDSPGGSVGASQEIYRAIERFRETGKPVIISMGNVAASGGYYVSSAGTYIFANPGTITGSIGVIIQHIAYRELMEKLGIKATAIKTGKFKDTLSPFRELTEEEKKYLQETVNEALEQFIQAILKYRKEKISEEKLRSIADGRIFTGERALELGLVDALGSLHDAIEKAKEISGYLDAKPLFIQEEKTLLKKLIGTDLQEIKLINAHTPLFYLMRY